MRVRTQAKREAILETAAQLFEEMGYENASMSELAKRVGGSKATLYGYFPSKESLLVAVVESFATAHLADATSQLSLEPGGHHTLGSILMRFGEEMLEVLTNDRRAIAIYRMVVAESGRSEVGKLFHDAGPSQSIDALARLMGAAIERGEMRAGEPRVIAQQFLSLLTAEINSRQFEQRPAALTRAEIGGMVDRAVDMFLRGAAPRPSGVSFSGAAPSARGTARPVR